ncbi:MAG: STAS domain-containing protein [Chloroflexi bacterium]|nr:STAS domain-containing protein [Chloroflexota bacterium]
MGYFAQPIRIIRQYQWEDLRPDFVAGLTVAIVSLPQAIVFAFIAGLPPAMGLYGIIVGSIVGALWGSSRHMHSGPTNTSSLLTLSVVMSVAVVGTPEFAAAAGLLALMVGVFRLVVGVARLGMLANFVSDAVIVGFTAGAGILIAINQLPHLLGLHLERSPNFLGTLEQIGVHLPEVHTASLIIGVGSMLVIVLLRRINPKLPGPLIAMVLAALAVGFYHLDQQGVVVIGELPRGLPPLASIPVTNWDLIGKLSTGALAIGAIGLVEATSISRSIASLTGQRLDSNQEFVGQGLACIACGLFSGYVSSASFNRSAVNLQAGARTQVAAALSGVLVLTAMIALAPYAALLPRAALAGVLMIIAYRMVDRQEIIRLLHGGRGDAVIMVATLLATLLLPLEFAVLVGIFMSLGRYILRTSMPTVLPVLPDDQFKHLYYQPDKPQCPQLAVIEIQGDLYFGAVNHVEEVILENMNRHPGQIYLLLRMQNVHLIDISGIHMLESIVHTYRETGGDVFFVKVRPYVFERMKLLGFLDRVGEDHFLEEDEAISHIFYRVLDPVVCIYECETRAFAECQNLPRPSGHMELPSPTPADIEDVRWLKPTELYQMLRKPNPPLVIDVREPREYRKSHIPQAKNAPLSKLLQKPIDLPKDRPIVLTCRTSRRSRRAAYLLKQRGHQNLAILDGGMVAWENAELLTAVDESPFYG